METKRGDPKKRDAEVVDTLTAISVVAKRLATRIRASNTRQKRKGDNHGKARQV